MPVSSVLLSEIDVLLQKISEKRPLNAGEKKALQQALQVAFTYHSNAIEGNTLTLSETKIVLEDGLTIGGKTIREIDEARNHKKCFTFLETFLLEKKELTEEVIILLHGFILQSIDDENAGKYRSIEVYISGEEKLPPKPLALKNEIKMLFEWYESHKNTLHPVLLAAAFYYRLVKIHPFVDGNGRLARLCINLILMSKGFPMIIIPSIRRAEYISSLHSRSSYDAFEEFFCDIVLVNLQDYVRMIED